ncbi:MAG: protein kinase, partial [Methanobacterium sp.]|nr:protein kinase [Methanobacterium sp.]
ILSILLLLIPLFLSSSIASANTNVLFDETGPYEQKDFTIYNLGPIGESSFAALLEANGFTVKRTTQTPLTYDELKNYQVLVLMAPARNYTDTEISAIQEYVRNGGGLLLVGNGWNTEDGGQDYAFNKIAESFGVDYKSTILVGDSQQYFASQTKAKITNLTQNPLTSNLNYFYYFQGTYMQNTGNTTVLAYSSPTSYADKGFLTSDGYSMTNEIKDANETSGPFPVFSTMTYGNGKIVFFGSVGDFMNSWLYRSNGWIIGLNSLNWLSNKPVQPTYVQAGLFSPTVADMPTKILETLVMLVLVVLGLIFALMKMGKLERTYPIKTIKNRTYYILAGLNIFFTVLGSIIFIPINFLLMDVSSPAYDPFLGYLLLITGIIYIVLAVMNLYSIIFRERMISRTSILNIGVLIIFTFLTVILGDLFSFSSMELFTVGGIILMVPYIINLWFIRNHGPDLIIEGKEFNRLAKLSVKTLPYELHGTYKNPSFIGEGGFGRVYKAVHNEREVALKIPKTFDKRSEKTFISEVSNWSQLEHPNIVKLYGFKILPIPFIEMEYCEGSLKHAKLSIQEAINVIYEAANGLAYAHSKNIIHGDIKTSNILIKNGIYKVTDWGLSKLMGGESVTLSGATPQYAAPEQISNQYGKADERTDIYQLGTVFYELVTGNLPFEGEIAAVYGSILNTTPKLPSEIDSSAKFVEPIIMKCLSKNKDERFNSMRELIQELEENYDPEKFDEKTVMFKDKE